jgi:hypothetical protein
VPLQPVRQLRLRQHEWGTENVLAQESNSMDRSVIVPRGSYTVKAQGAVTHSDVRFRVDDWSLTVEKARVS